jgi:ribose transport system substrate-binding protein
MQYSWIIFILLIGVVMILVARRFNYFGLRKYRLGFCQIHGDLPWRLLFDQELREEASKHPELTVLYTNSLFSVEKQIADLESFIRQKVDLIFLSPQNAAALVPVVEKARVAGIPVILLDREVDTEQYAAYIGVDHYGIGQAVGTFAVNLLKGRGGIAEIRGFKEDPTAGQHFGFYDVVKNYPNIRIVHESEGKWEEEESRKIMEGLLASGEKIDLVYAHDDTMALGAWEAARAAGREKEIKFLGVNADPGPQGGCQAVVDGKLEATFLYPTPGAEAVKQALLLLKGREIPKKITLPTIAVIKDFAPQYANRHRPPA